MNKNTRATEEYVKTKKQCLALVKRIQRGINVFSKPSERINYGHVGSLSRVKEQLEDICEFLNT